MAERNEMPNTAKTHDALSTLTRVVNRVLETFIVILFAALVVVVVIQVGSRYIFNSPTTWTEEAARFLFIWLGLIGAAYASGGMRHLSIDLLPIMLHGISRKALQMLLEIMVIGFAYSVLVRGGYSLASRTLMTGQVTPALNLPMGWIYFALPISGVLIIFFAIVHLIRLAQNKPLVEGGEAPDAGEAGDQPGDAI